jgi:hypothetical protein
MHAAFQQRNFNESNHLEELCRDVRTVLIIDIKAIRWVGMEWIHLDQDRHT